MRPTDAVDPELAAALIARFSEALLADLELRPVLRNLLGTAAQTLGAERSAVFLYHPEEGELRGEVASGRGHNYTVSTLAMPLGRPGPVQAAFFAGPEGLERPGECLLPIIASPAPQGGTPLCWVHPEERCGLPLRIRTPQRSACCPSCPHFGGLGVLSLEGRLEPALRPLLPALARLAALAIRNARLFDEVQAARQGLQRQAQTLEAERRKLAEVLEQMADGVVVIEGGRVSANRLAREALGLGAQVGPEQLPAFLGAALEGGPAEVELGGRYYSVLGTRGAGFAVLALHDLTPRVQAEQGQREFIAAVSHELRTPLVGILGFAELLLRDEGQPEETLEFVRIIHDNGLRLKNMVANVLDTSKLEAGRFAVNLHPVDLGPVVRQTAAGFGGVAQLSGVGFELEMGALPRVRADAERVGQVVGNLLSNAFKHTPKGGLVDLRLWADPWTLFIQVADTGPGIPPEGAGQLFQRYGHGRAAGRGASGTGLGLYISKAIVEAHGGRIYHGARAGRGAVFTVEIPLG